MALDIRPTTLAKGKCFQWFVSLAAIAHIMARLDIARFMQALWFAWTRIDRNHVVKSQAGGIRLFESAINRFVADIAGVTVAIKNSLIVYLMALISGFTAAFLFSVLQQSLGLFAILAIVGVAAFALFIRDGLIVFVVLPQYLISDLRPPRLTMNRVAVSTPCKMPIRRIIQKSKLIQRLFLLTLQTPLMSRGSRGETPYFAPSTSICRASVIFVHAILACSPVASCVKWVSIKLTDRLFDLTLLANDGSNRFALWRVFKVTVALFPAPLVGASDTPRMRFAAPTRASFTELIKGLFDMAKSTYFGLTKERELSDMIECSHGYVDLLNRFTGLAGKGAANTFISAQSFVPIIPRNRLRSQFIVPLTGRKAVL